MDRQGLVSHLRSQFALDWTGIHGASHWARVRVIGSRLARRTGADPLVVELFAWLHDARRWNDGTDALHGQRAAELAEELCGQYFELSRVQLELLCTACRGHSDGHTRGDISVLTCWDSDRLDLGRIGVRPDPSRLCTEPAREAETRRWAWSRARRWAARQRT